MVLHILCHGFVVLMLSSVRELPLVGGFFNIFCFIFRF